MKILEYPNPVLKQKSEPVKMVDDDLRAFMDEMLQTMHAAVGAGLAAPQVGVLKRVVVLEDCEEEDKEAREVFFMANPEILWRSDEHEICTEGCLSVPEVRAEVERPAKIKVRYLDYDNKEQTREFDGFVAVTVQHEIDHLDGVLYIDHLSRLKRQMLVKKMHKIQKEKEE